MVDSRAPRSWLVPVLVVMAVATVVRVAIVGDTFWLDEIWSWNNVRAFESFGDIFAHEKAKLDNNHILVTAWMYWIGDQDQWVWYRLPCLLAGLVTVFTALDRERGAAGVFVPGTVFAVSMLLVLYATEARGYALAGCFALLGYRLLRRRMGDDFALRPWEFGVFPLLVILCALGHLVGVHFYFGAIAWTSAHLLRRQPAPIAIRRLLCLHAPACVLLLVFYLGHVRNIKIGGGGELHVGWVLSDAMAWMSGAPNEIVVAWLLGLVVFGFVAFEVVQRAREGSLEWVFVVSTVVVAPLLILTLKGTQGILYARHFYVGSVFVLYYFSAALLRLHQRGRSGVAIGLVVLFVLGNGWRFGSYLTKGGRGQQPQVLADMLADSPPRFLIGAPTQHRFRVFFPFNYYKRFVPPGRELIRMRDADHHPVGPDWFVFQTTWNEDSHHERLAQPPPEIALPSGHRYRLVKEYPHYGQSGVTWTVYRRL